MALKVNDDHWAFLEEFEAPMWADLSLEANSNDHHYIDDEWFYTIHRFHECSSSDLKSMFLHGGDERTTLDSDLLGPSSPKLPHSVSKSRGKEYRSKKWKGDNQGVSFDKGHPVKVLTGKSSCAKPGLRNKVKHKSNSIHLNEVSTSKSSVVGESSSSGKAVSNSPKPLSVCYDPGSSLSSKENKTSDSNSTITITSENGQENKVMDRSSCAYGQTNDLLSMMKKCLRKSYITRQATRVEINNDGKQSRGCNSTSSKSSVGSSSNPRNNIRVSMSTSVRSKETTPDSRNVARAANLATGNTNSSGIVKASTTRTKEGASNNRRGQVNTAKPACNETAKQKVHCRDSSIKALVPSRVNAPNSTFASTELKKKMGMSRVSDKLSGDVKENVTGRTSVTQKKGKVSSVAGGKGIDGDQKVTKQSLSVRSNTAGSICSKGKVKGRGNLEKPKNSVQRVHFR